MAGYNEFVDMLKKKGFPAQSPGAFSFDQKAVRDIFHEVFGEDFGKDSRNKNFRLSDAIQIDTGRQMINMTFMGVLEFDKAGQEFIQTYEIASIVCISYHKLYVKETLELAKLLLDRWGGWIGNDSDGFLPVFDAANISSFM